MFLGRWPEKSVKYITRLLKNAESNADAKNIDLEDLLIKSIVVEQAPVRMPQQTPISFHTNRITENPPPYIPCPRSYQPLPRSPVPHRGHSHIDRRRSRAKQRQGRCWTFSYWPQQTASRKKEDRSCSHCMSTLSLGGELLCDVKIRYVSQEYALCHDTQ